MHAPNIAMTTETASIRYRVSPSSLGPVLVAATDRGVCAILFGDGATPLESDLASRFPDAALIADDNMFDPLADQVVRFIEQAAGAIDFPLDPSGTDFQKRVWQALREIKPGTTTSYKEVAMRIGAPKAVRAIARACAANPLAVAIPCQRVVRSDGSMSGYRWGTARKRALLDREARS